MTYNQKLRKIMATMDDWDAADSEAEWAANILKAIGITPETPDGIADVQPKDIAKQIKPHPNIPMPCCEKPETRTPNCFVPIDQVPDFKSKGW